jgi:predicted nucleotidyltransferase
MLLQQQVYSENIMILLKECSIHMQEKTKVEHAVASGVHSLFQNNCNRFLQCNFMFLQQQVYSVKIKTLLYICRRRQKLKTLVQVVLPPAMLLILVMLQQAIPPSEFENCQFRLVIIF